MNTKIKLVIIFSVLIFIILPFVGVTTYSLLAFDNWKDRGTFGDAFGAADAFLSATALIGVVVALIFQFEQTHATLKEMAIVAKSHAEQAHLGRESERLTVISGLIQALQNEEQDPNVNYEYNGKRLSAKEIRKQLITILIAEVQKLNKTSHEKA
jgi:hypothetical protein